MQTQEQFRQLGYAYFENILTDEMCTRFANLMMEMKETGHGVNFEGKSDANPNSFYNQSWGGNHPEFEETLRNHVQPRLEEELGFKLKPSNSFGRIYYNGGTLDRHVDRQGLDYTMSITLYSNLDESWPLWCIDKEGTEVPLHIGRGDGGIMYGTAMPHWRDPLVCKDDQYVIQLFMHWTYLD